MSVAEVTAPAGTKATRKAWIGLAVLVLPTLLLSLDMSVLYLALPQVTADLHVSATQQLWVVDIYGFLIAGFLITMGTLGDRIGRRRLLMIGASCFGVASVLAAYSVSAEMLIATRALLGIAGATLMPSTLALITNMFRDEHQRGVAIAVWMCGFMGGMTVGPLVGGVLLEHFWWGSAFLIGVPVMALLLVAAPRLLPEYRDDNAGRLDLRSVALSLASILPMIYGLKELARQGWAPLSAGAIVAGAGLAVMFVRRQRRLANPLLDLDLFRSRPFTAAIGINLGGGVVMAGTFLLITLYLQLVLGFSPLHAGVWLVPMNLAMVASTMLAPQFARRFRPAFVIATGLVVAAAGLFLLTQVDPVGGLPVLVTGFSLASVGIAVPTALGVNLIMGSAPPEKAGSASGVSETSGEFGIALGVALLGSLGTLVYRAHVTTPPELSSSDAATAGESLTGAVSVAPHLPQAVADGLITSAREAFTVGLNVAGLVGCALLLALAVVALAAFRDRRGPDSPDDDDLAAAPNQAPAQTTSTR